MSRGVYRTAAKSIEALRPVAGEFFAQARADLEALRDQQALELEEFGKKLGARFDKALVDHPSFDRDLLADVEDTEELVADLTSTDTVNWDLYWDNVFEDLEQYEQEVDEAIDAAIEEIRAEAE